MDLGALTDAARRNAWIAERTDVLSDPALCPNPRVSVVVHTYNHAAFLEQAVASVLAQQCPFAFEVLIGDDASSDGAREIAHRLHRAAPDRVVVLAFRERVRSCVPSSRLNLLRSFDAARGEYIAYLEGDDYWTSTGKLAAQVEYMDENPGAAGCFHDGICVASCGAPREPIFRQEYRPTYDQRACLQELRSRYPSASLLFRASVVKGEFPRYWLEQGSDFLLDLVITRHGTLDFLPLRACAYRIHPDGSWTRLAASERLLRMIHRLDAVLSDPGMADRYGSFLRERVEQLLIRMCESARREGRPWEDQVRLALTTGSYPGLVRRLRLFARAAFSLPVRAARAQLEAVGGRRGGISRIEGR